VQGGNESALMFCTNSVLLRRLTRGDVKEELHNITHIVIDEIHERDRYADFMLVVRRPFPLLGLVKGHC
jgi:ATP-dependent RNA helicase DHX36